MAKNESQEKITRENFFDLEIFSLKYVLKHESIPTKKISTKIFGLCHFFTILGLLAEKRLSPMKKFCKGKKFSITRFSVLTAFKTRFEAPKFTKKYSKIFRVAFGAENV